MTDRETAPLTPASELAYGAPSAGPHQPEHVQVGVIRQVTDRAGRDRFEIMLVRRVIDLGLRLFAAPPPPAP